MIGVESALKCDERNLPILTSSTERGRRNPSEEVTSHLLFISRLAGARSLQFVAVGSRR